MRRLTEQERIALVEVGEPGEGPIPDAIFDEFVKLGWGRWARCEGFRGWALRRRYWQVTPAGRYALELDTIAKRAGGPE